MTSIVIACGTDAIPNVDAFTDLPNAVIARYDASGLAPVIAMAQALTYYTTVLVHQKPTLVVVMGDRPEGLAAALAAMFLRIPVSHAGDGVQVEFGGTLGLCISNIASVHPCSAA